MEIIKFVQSFSNPVLDRFFILATMMGEDYFFIAIVTLILWCINKKFGYKIAFAYFTSGMLNAGLKEYFQAPRPIGQPGIRSLRAETATGYSFPSGHTQSAASFWTSAAVRMGRKWLYAVGGLMILLVALSRVYLGVHYPSDVIFGGLIGIGWVFVSNRIFELVDNKGMKWILLVFAIPILVGACFLKPEDYFKGLGIAVSFIVGYVIESKYIQYETKATVLKQAAKFIIGITVLIAIKTLLKPLLPEAPLSYFLRYFLMGIWATVLAPLLFKRYFNKR